MGVGVWVVVGVMFGVGVVVMVRVKVGFGISVYSPPRILGNHPRK